VLSRVWWHSAGRSLPLEASGQRVRSLVTPVSERGLGEVRAGSLCVLGLGWCCSGGADRRLGVLIGRGGGEKKWRGSPPRSSRAPPIPCVQGLQDKGLGWGVRESRGRWSGSRLGSFSRSSCKEKRERGKEEKE
jgi:hypothetical protein